MYLWCVARWRETFLAVLSFSVALVAVTARADEVDVQTVLTGLSSPCGAAVRPGGAADRYEIFVSDTAAGRIVRMWSHEPGTSDDVVTGIPHGAAGNQAVDASGPRGLTFLARHHVVVVGGQADQGQWVRLYALPDDHGPIDPDSIQQQLEWTPPADASGSGGRQLFALTRTRANEYVPDMLVVTALGAGGRGWLGKTVLLAGTLGDLEPFAAAEQGSSASATSGIAVSERGYVVVSEMGEVDKSRDSELVYYHPIDRSPVLRLATELRDVVGLAYSPITGNLYAADFAAAEPNDGGIYRIDDASRPGRPACKAVRVAKVLRPTALAFGPKGALYVTSFGRGNGQGTLVKLSGEM